jgi:hypothetical protein
MMTVRCFRCGMHFQLNRAVIEQAVASAEASHAKTYSVECVKCRHVNKVPIAQMRRFVPRPAPVAAGSAMPASPEGAPASPQDTPGAETPAPQEATPAESIAKAEPAAAPAATPQPAQRVKRGAATKRSKAPGA